MSGQQVYVAIIQDKENGQEFVECFSAHREAMIWGMYKAQIVPRNSTFTIYPRKLNKPEGIKEE